MSAPDFGESRGRWGGRTNAPDILAESRKISPAANSNPILVPYLVPALTFCFTTIFTSREYMGTTIDEKPHESGKRGYLSARDILMRGAYIGGLVPMYSP